MELDRTTFLPGLEELAAVLRNEGLVSSLGRKPLALGLWDFTVNAAADGIDWFELRPEIRCNGELLAVEEIRRLLKEGVLRQGNNCYLLGDEQRGILELLTGGGDGKGKRRKKAEIVRIPRLRILDWLELRSRGVTLRLPREGVKTPGGPRGWKKFRNSRFRRDSLPSCGRTRKRASSGSPFSTSTASAPAWPTTWASARPYRPLPSWPGSPRDLPDQRGGAAAPHRRAPPSSSTGRAKWPDSTPISRSAPTPARSEARSSPSRPRPHELRRGAAGYRYPRPIPFHVVVFDEAQQVKNIHAETTGAVRRISARFKLTLTGTPMENHLGEYYSIMDLWRFRGF